jgi:quercetin dioxygenase-like cupin family protein
MDVTTVEAAFEDDRGTITDLIENTDYAVTIVRSEAGAVRGNHLHKKTAQWAYVLSGRMRVTTGPEQAEVRAGQMVFNQPGEPHAWLALQDTVCVVFAKGPRAGRNYESDTYRLEDALIS